MLNQDFKEFLELLNVKGVHYLVVGGYALSFHGHPRYTKDLDIWIEQTPKNAELMIDVLCEFGFGSLGIKSDDLLDPDQILQFGYPPVRIDVITTLSGVKFPDCYPHRARFLIDGVQLYVIDKENLIRNKRASGRMQDLADIELLEGK